LKNFLPLFLFLLLPFYNFAKNSLYFNDFSTQKDFSHTETSYFTQKQYHIFNPHTGDFYENPSFIPPENHHIQAKIISSNLYNLEVGEENFGGVSFRGDEKNSLVVLLYPQKKQFAFLQYQSPQNNGQDNNNTEWTLITVKEDPHIHPHFNVLDVISLKDKIFLFINGQKAYEGVSPQNKNIPKQGYMGFYTSQNTHFHFENLRVWEANSNYLDNLEDFSPLSEKKNLSQDFNNQYLKNYGSLGKLITSYSFSNNSDSPFEIIPQAHAYLGKLEVFSPNKKLDLHAAKTIQVSNALIETSVKKKIPIKIIG